MAETLQRMMEHKLVAVIRGAEGEEVLPIARALHDGGIHILEITADTPQVSELIRSVNDEFSDEVIVGAGTVLDPETARAAIMAGARFIFSPTVNRDTIQLTKRYGVVSIPGAMTPTEILTAYEHGADLIKVFPAGTVGPGYIKDVHGPFPHIPLMPTGGVNLSNIREYFEKGAVAAGLGGSLVNTKQPMNKDALEDITEKAQQFVKAIKDVQ
ncbi:bifunctional 4-hydroxy-2-oxoglutarate aldolase/2-dehydro-3-deoxy-phosphogluconate aldolase [Halobacillus naozhouensis]|uniref:Bifunctional 4-hydroxy-2-oxoglutarate aldolase/2-dehydro-3-deoxy-phosphogluconate aldolase n=1 Tax=Halobacillus naozhouensis TaxID=554880 RepID=A0ABY8IXM3_9BACI|nr:bifunctional 4-hydroxy-2-oxoglutarate aldolase/2-dehydro-3-deoxy-phosphogluconate aldolase [Halobacillus naozhouensis]WFT73929.1 bifunctional 4-hydroxy-2-oxoglutarate aldolase/2-dehydro-3-deoxy-phosphogluconate aldolase [Halobacillus naozhouensis]